jgi:ribonuclease BN (tRNA processing enzyme)
MELKFLGVGSAFATEHFQSNLLLTVNGKNLLIDAGGTIHLALKAAQIAVHELDAVYISHRHGDHWGGSEFIASASYYNPAFIENGVRRKLKLFAHPYVRAVLWRGLDHSLVLDDKVATLEDYFDVRNIASTFEWQGVTFAMMSTVHCIDNGKPMPCFVLTWFTPANRRIWFSADAILQADNPLFDAADVIFHDCNTGKKVTVHAHYSELLGLPAAVRSKMTLYHYGDGALPDAKADGFAGWAQEGVSISL